MADISIDLGSLTVGIDIPFIKFPSTSIGVGGYIPVTPAIALGGSLELSPRPTQVEFNLNVGVKLLNFLEIEYQVLQWTIQNPLLPPGSIGLPLPLPPFPYPDEPEIIEPDTWELDFDEAGTLYATLSCDGGLSGTSVIRIQPGNSFGGGSAVDGVCQRSPTGDVIVRERWFLNGVPTPVTYCTVADDGTGDPAGYGCSTATYFVPDNPASPIRIGIPRGNPDMSCTCAEIQALLQVQFAALTAAIEQRLNCLQEDTRSLRISFQGQPQTATANYSMTGSGVTGVLPGDALQLVVTPTALPAGESQWLTTPKLYQLAIVIPIFQDGNYGAPVSVVVPFGTGCRVFVQFANIRQFAYSLLPGVSANLAVLYQTAPNAERSEWC